MASTKVTRAQIEDSLRREQRAEPGAWGAGVPGAAVHPNRSCSHPDPVISCPPPIPVEKVKSHLELPLEENLNRRAQEEGSLEARTVEDAIAVLRWAWPWEVGRGLAGVGGA